MEILSGTAGDRRETSPPATLRRPVRRPLIHLRHRPKINFQIFFSIFNPKTLINNKRGRPCAKEDGKRKEEAVSTNTAAGWQNSVGGLPTTAAAVLMHDLNEVVVVGGREVVVGWGGGGHVSRNERYFIHASTRPLLPLWSR